MRRFANTNRRGLKRWLALGAIVGLCGPVFAQNVTFEQNGLIYLSSTNGYATITGYNGSGGAVSIPSSINIPATLGISGTTVPVTGIGTGAFAACSGPGLTSVTIPASVNGIAADAFNNCAALTSVYFMGNAFWVDPSLFTGDVNATAYDVLSSTGWGTTFGALPVALDRNVEFDQTSNPVSIVNQTTYPLAGTMVSTVIAPSPASGYSFTFWTVDGVRMADPSGCATNPATFVVTGPVAVVANYVPTTQDTLGDGIPDWWKLYYFGSLSQGAANIDPFGDGYTNAMAYANGMNPNVVNTFAMGGISRRRGTLFKVTVDGLPPVEYGGISRRRSAATTVVLNTAAYSVLQQTSSPPGIILSSSVIANGSTVNLITPPSPYNGYYFTGWMLNGTGGKRIDQPTQNQPIPLTVNANTTVVARYINGSDQTAGDAYPDWQELFYFNALGYGPNDDYIGDGFTLAQDLLYGFSPVVANQLQMGGVSRRRSAMTTVILNTATYSVLQQTSSPPGIILSSSVIANGSTVNLIVPPNPSNGYYFTGWMLNGTNGTRIDQPTQNQPIPIVINANTSVVARYINGSNQTAGDAYPDWQEMFYFNALGCGPNDDPIGDGFTLAQDQLYGFLPMVKNQLQMGGVSRRRGMLTAVNAEFLPNPPAVGINAATNITQTTAQLSAMVNPIGSDTLVYFKWGLTSTYGNQSVPQDIGNGLTALPVTVVLTGLAPGAQYYFQVVATNAQGTTTGSNTSYTTSQTNFQRWAQIYGVGGPLDNPARDGIPNLMKFATGLDPIRFSQAPGQLTFANGVLTYTYNRADAAVADGLTFAVEWSDTLTAGSWSNVGVSEVILSDNGVIQQVSSTIPVGSSAHQFVRLRVIQP